MSLEQFLMLVSEKLLYFLCTFFGIVIAFIVLYNIASVIYKK